MLKRILNLVLSLSLGLSALTVKAAAQAPETAALASEIAAPSFPGEDERGQELLQDLFKVSVLFKLETNLLSQNKRRLAQQKRQLQEAYREHHHLAEGAEPEFFGQINEKAQEAVQIRQNQKKQELIAAHRSGLDPVSLSQEALEALYLKCYEEDQLLKNISSQFQALIDFSKTEHVVSLSRVSNCEFKISTENCLLGYSIFDLLNISRIRVSASYDGSQEFVLSLEELKRLYQWFQEIHKWIKEFSEICTSLIGDGYIELGQKSVRELVTSASFLSLGLREASVIRDEFLSFGESEKVLLFNTVSLNLERHPYKEKLKTLFESTYKKENLRARNGREKKFLDQTFRSNIGAPQLEKICPHLNKEIKIKQLVEEIFGENSYLSGVAEEMGLNSLETLKQFKAQGLNSLAQVSMGDQYNGLRDFGRISARLDRARSVAEAERSSLELCHHYLENYLGICFKASEESASLSEEQKEALYRGEPECQYDGMTRHKNIRALFLSLKESAAFCEAQEKMPGVLESVNDLERQLLVKLNNYHQLPQDSQWFGRPLVDEALNYFETYVAKIVYKEALSTSQSSIENSFNKLASIIGDDLAHGCANGLAGRMNDLLLSLVSSAANDLEEAFEAFKMQAYQESLNLLRQGHEGSMHVRTVNGELAPLLGLPAGPQAAQVAKRNIDELSSYHTKRVMKDFSERFNPKSLYHHLRKMLGEKFWQLNSEHDDEGMYALLLELKMGESREELDSKYRVNKSSENRWQYAFFQQDLAEKLVTLLLERGIFYQKTAVDTNLSVMTALGFEFHAVGYVPAFAAAAGGGAAAAAPQAPAAQGGGGLGFQSQSQLPPHYQGTSG